MGWWKKKTEKAAAMNGMVEEKNRKGCWNEWNC